MEFNVALPVEALCGGAAFELVNDILKGIGWGNAEVFLGDDCQKRSLLIIIQKQGKAVVTSVRHSYRLNWLFWVGSDFGMPRNDFIVIFKHAGMPGNYPDTVR